MRFMFHNAWHLACITMYGEGIETYFYLGDTRSRTYNIVVVVHAESLTAPSLICLFVIIWQETDQCSEWMDHLIFNLKIHSLKFQAHLFRFFFLKSESSLWSGSSLFIRRLRDCIFFFLTLHPAEVLSVWMTSRIQRLGTRLNIASL